MKNSGQPDVYKRAFASKLLDATGGTELIIVVGILHGDDSYMDVLIELLLRYILVYSLSVF
jgi:hypothetical protein